MKALSWMRSRPKTLASAAVVTVGAIAITTMAFSYEGFPTTEVDLHDGGVWITKSSSLLVGHFNAQSTVLDGGLRTVSESYDVLQDGDTVLIQDQTGSTVTTVDPARVSLGDSTAIPGAAKVALGNRTTAILDRSSGYLWVVPVSGLSGFEIQGADPYAELGENADVTVGQDGTVYAVSAEDAEVLTILVDPQGEAMDSSSASLGELGDDTEPTITAVGQTPVVLDPVEGLVITPGGIRTEIPGAETAVLQQTSAETAAVTIANESDLVTVPFDGSEPQLKSSGGQGVPAAPVSLSGCTYGAWAGSAKFVRDCASDANDLDTDITDAQDATQLTFRVNRDVVVLNDIVGGAAWMATDSLQRVDNWNDITPPEGETENEEDSTEETVETTLPERSEENTPPVAVDDDFGVRPGRSTVLPVLDNDTDADGDVLVASLAEKQPSIGEVQPIQNGGSLQISVEEDAAGSATFTYEADDGRPRGTDTATVQVTVHDWSINSAPTQKRRTSLAVESGGTVSYNVLPDWIDPDGDDIYLKSVTAAPGDEVDFTTDGQITYNAVSSLQGRKEVQITVADGLNEVATGTISLDVRPSGSTLPKTNADHVVTRVGQQVSVAPLANDTSSGREPLRLARVDEVPDATISADTANKTFTFTSEKPGVYYVQYLVSAGPNAVPGLVRVDVLDEVEQDLPPVAVRDVALLPTGGEVLLGVLNNDTDPSGGILVVQSVTVEPGSGISVSVLNHETLRIGDQGALDEQVRITYRISNGSKTAEGDVIIIPIPAPDQILPPVANDDEIVVRVGDVVTIPVLDNDTHPNNDALHVAPDLIEPLIDPEDGEAFVSQDTVRFKAGDEAKTVYATYEAVDTNGQKDAGYVTIQILPVDEEKNAAPRPEDVTARALSGSSVKIAIPLDGIDADGDSVELLGLDSSPSKGRLVEVGQNFLMYEAFEDSTGVDTFTYRVRDRLGKEGVATIRIGIAPGEEVNQAPYAVKDAVVVRPGREVAVPVLANDSDPEGDTLALVSDGLVMPNDVDGLEARVSGDRVIVEVPDRELETSLQYTIRDERGAEAKAVLQITVDEDVPLLTPIARDDRIMPTDLTEGLTVDFPVLTNDEDPDGVVDALTLDVAAGGTVLEDGTVRVTVGEERQLIRYTITDRDDLSASAFIFVPAISEMRPTLASTQPVEVVSGETVSLPLSEYVTVAGGGDVVITEASKVSAVHSDGSSLIENESTLTYTSEQGYYGSDGLTFEVTDGTGPDDPEGRKSTLTIPITVIPPENQQPEFTRAEMNVAPGEDATSLDLAALVTDPDPEDEGVHTFEYVSGAVDGISARVDGDRLLVEAASTTTKGTSATLALRVTDGTTEPVEGLVTVRVTASTRSLATANTDTIAEANQGETVRVPVLVNDFNPFPETPLKIVSALPESGVGTAAFEGDEVVVTPGADFVGTMTVRYRIQDATGDADREVDGTVVLTVQGVPEAPGAPGVSSVQDRTVVLSWSPPSNNGAEITGYTVRSVQGNSYTKQCSSTTCTLDGLTNNVEYVFQVTATNRVGESEPSGSSEVARPDARPDTPNPPSLEFGDRALDVSWRTPTTPGSPVETFTLEISPAPPSGVTQKSGVTGNSLTWEGLENGTDYQVRVQAHNRAPEPSSWSGWSPGEIPAGPPAPPAAPTTAELAPVGKRAQMEVSWNAPANNGDAVAGYRLRVHRGGSVVQTIPVSAGSTSQAVVVDTSQTDYTFTVRATNKAGWGEWSAASAPRRGVVRPDAPTAVSATAGNNTVSVTYTKGSNNGASASEVTYQYSVNNGGWRTDWNGSTIGNGQVNNNGSYSVRVRAVATVSGTTYVGAESAASNSVQPSGPPGQPNVNGSVNGTRVNWSWSLPNRNGSDLQIRWNDGNGWSSWGSSGGSKTTDYGYSHRATLTVEVRDAQNRQSTNSVSRTTVDRPQPTARTIMGPSSGKCNNDDCRYLRLDVSNFPAGEYVVHCLEDGRRFAGGYTWVVPANGTGAYPKPEPNGGCYHGGFNHRYKLSLEIVGWGTATATTWQ
ncbi:MAG: Ig-like domain-containing protein [Actinomycetota bacterium]